MFGHGGKVSLCESSPVDVGAQRCATPAELDQIPDERLCLPSVGRRRQSEQERALSGHILGELRPLLGLSWGLPGAFLKLFGAWGGSWGGLDRILGGSRGGPGAVFRDLFGEVQRSFKEDRFQMRLGAVLGPS